MALDRGQITVRTPINIRLHGVVPTPGAELPEDWSAGDPWTVRTTLGRVLFNELLPAGYPFVNQELPKKVQAGIVNDLAEHTLPADIGTALYRIAQEALTNVAKHARARHVSVILEKADGTVRLIVEDDGAGFDVEATTQRATKEGRFGLAGSRERAELVGGTFTVESGAAGTTIFVRLPAGPGW